MRPSLTKIFSCFVDFLKEHQYSYHLLFLAFLVHRDSVYGPELKKVAFEKKLLTHRIGFLSIRNLIKYFQVQTFGEFEFKYEHITNSMCETKPIFTTT